jgi:bacterial/archaeal transporter family protein
MPVWIAWTLLTLVSWGIWAILSKLIGDRIAVAHVQAISTLGVLPILVVLLAAKDSSTAGNRRLGILLALGSGIVSCAGNIAYYASLNQAKAATIIPLTALYPVVTVILAVPLLKERVNVLQWMGIGLSLAAMYLFNVPQAAAEDSNLITGWILLPLTAIVLWGITGLMQKASTNYISARASAVWFLAAFVPFAGLILVNDPLPSSIEMRTWALAAAMGFMLALGNLTVLLAFSSGGNASIIAPLAGLYPLVSIPIAVFGFDERLGWRETTGIALALAAVVLLSLQSGSNSAADSIETDIRL